MPRQVSAHDVLRRRIQKWEDEDPTSILTKRMERAAHPLQWLVALLLPDSLIQEVTSKTLWVAEAITDRDDVLKSLQIQVLDDALRCRIDRCDAVANDVHNWAIGSAAALGAWDLAGPLGIAPALASLFTLSFRTIKKIGLCFGYDTATPYEEMIVLEIFNAASSLYHRDKVVALKSIHRSTSHADGASRDSVAQTIDRLSRAISTSLTRRRAFAAIPAMGALVGGSANAWLLKDAGWAARNIYALRRLEDEKRAAAVPAKAA